METQRMKINIKLFSCFFLLLFAIIIFQAHCQNKTADNFSNEVYISKEGEKFGLLDKGGVVVLPHIYHDIRRLNDYLFVVQDTDSLCSEYVVNANGKILTAPVFCAIDSFKRGKIFQSWNGTTLIYAPNGDCLSSTEKQEIKGLFKVFLMDSLTKQIYKPTTKIDGSVQKIELIFVSPNHYQYMGIEGKFIVIQRRGCADKIKNNLVTIECTKRDGTLAMAEIVVEVYTIKMQNTKTKEEKILKRRDCNYRFNKLY